MATVDTLVLGLYAVVILIVGVYPGKVGGREAFLISDRRLNAVWSGFSIAASKIGGGLLVTYSTLVFVFGYEALWLFVGYIVGYGVFYIFASKIHSEAHSKRYYTLADYFQSRYGRFVALVVGALCTVTLAGWIMTNLIAGGSLIAGIAGLSPIVATALMAGVIGVYLLVGGFHAVVRTDLIQYASLIVIAALIAVALATTDHPLSAAPQREHISIGRILAFLLFGIFFPMGSAELWQRAYATKTTRDLRRAIILASASFVVLGLVMSYVCLRLQAILGSESELVPEARLSLGLASVLPAGLKGLWVTAFAAAILSSADTFVFTTASALGQDVIERAGAIKSANRIKLIRVLIILFLAAGVLGAAVFPDLLSVVFFFAGITMALGLVAFTSWLIPGISGTVLAYSLLIAFLAASVHAVTTGVTVGTAVVPLLVCAGCVLVGSMAQKLNSGRRKA